MVSRIAYTPLVIKYKVCFFKGSQLYLQKLLKGDVYRNQYIYLSYHFDHAWMRKKRIEISLVITAGTHFSKLNYKLAVI